jgi:hypothetical protein
MVGCDSFLSFITDLHFRRFGETLLGPARFTHIESCASEVCQAFKRSEEFKDCISTLNRLDAVLDGLRDEYDHGGSTGRTETTLTASRTPKNYANFDLVKLRRVIKARENSIKSVESLLAKRRELHDPTQVTTQ